MSTPLFAGAILDLDGTIVQSEHLHRLSWTAPLARLGITVDDETYFRDFAGKPGLQIIRDQLGITDPDKSEQLYQDVTAAYWELAEHAVQPTVGLMPFLHAINSVRTAVCTSARRDSAMRMLDLLGLTPLFTAVVTASDVTHGKPDPEPFVLAATRIEIAPEQCVAFEDSRNGLQSARTAGMHCVGIGEGRSLFHDAADLWIEDFTDPTLLALFGKADLPS